jgi:hypothetical protein
MMKMDVSTEAPGMTDVPLESGVGSGTGVGSGASSTTTVVVNSGGGAQQPPAQFGANNVSLEGGIDGVVSNPFAAKDVISVDVDPTLRKDLCLETNFCGIGMCIPLGTQSLFLKLPDCLGCGCMRTECCGSCACTVKFLQKPTCCQGVFGFTILDCSKLCKCGENDDVCCTCCSCEEQCTYCCLLQVALKMEYGIFKTLFKNWAWAFCCDGRCAIPCSSFSPCQAVCCGFGYRPWVKAATGESACGFRCRNDLNAGDAPAAGGSTTVVVVNNAG